MQPVKETKPTRFGITPILVLGYCLYYLSDVLGSRFETQGYGALCATILGVLAAALAFRALRKGNAGVDLRTWFRTRSTVLWSHSSAIIFAGALVFYIWGQSQIGFLWATAVVFPAILIFLRAGTPPRIILLSLLLTALAWLFLLELLNVPLPRSPWER